MTGPTAPPAPAPAPALIDEVLPRYQAREVHEIFVEAPQPDVYRALEALTLRELPLFRALMGVRALPARLARSVSRPAGPKRPRLLDPEVRLLDLGGTRGITETRVDTTDPLAHRRFGAYWRVIRVGSSAIRRSWLRGIKRRAEHSPRTAGPASAQVASRR